MTAPTNLAEALDCLQAFLPTDRGVTVSSYQPGLLGGAVYVHVTTGGLSDVTGEVRGTGKAFRATAKLSDALFSAEAEHAARWQRKFGAIEAAEAEFSQYCARVAA